MHGYIPLSEIGDMLIRAMRNRIRRCEGNRICPCWYIALRCRCESVCVHGLLTRAHSCHFAVMSSSPETSWARACDDEGNGLDDIHEVEGQDEVRVSKSPLTGRHKVACTSLEFHALQ